MRPRVGAASLAPSPGRASSPPRRFGRGRKLWKQGRRPCRRRARDAAPGARRSGPASGPSARSGTAEAQRFASSAPSLSLRGSGALLMDRLSEPLRSRRPHPANGCIRWVGIPSHHSAVSRVAGSRSCSVRWLHAFAITAHPLTSPMQGTVLARYRFVRTRICLPRAGAARGWASRSLRLAPARGESACCRFPRIERLALILLVNDTLHRAEDAPADAQGAVEAPDIEPDGLARPAAHDAPEGRAVRPTLFARA